MRHHFFRAIFVLLATSSTASVIAQEIGLELYSLRHQLEKDPTAAMAKVKQMGFRDVELSGTYGMEFPQLIKLLAENRLNVISYGAEFQRLRDFPQRVADEARSYGARFVVCFWIPHNADTFKLADADEAAFVIPIGRQNSGTISPQLVGGYLIMTAVGRGK